MNSDQIAVLVRITGRVQGVSFRAWTRAEAVKLGLTGWVRNEADGSVMALVAGPEEAVAAMLEAFWQGPPGASVSDVISAKDYTGEIPGDFSITG
ncbi:acylphosphatase [Brucella endophytica]|uniref:Acylphosphatase n=1 Tax=Brucella endophytica TaxID=1963359 RepID=A0A916S7P3_9HYPH|nr:acylphosphatase [Brucella endophytica]GGA84755.1 acylphosphatase [Brucella endophytica]